MLAFNPLPIERSLPCRECVLHGPSVVSFGLSFGNDDRLVLAPLGPLKNTPSIFLLVPEPSTAKPFSRVPVVLDDRREGFSCEVLWGGS